MMYYLQTRILIGIGLLQVLFVSTQTIAILALAMFTAGGADSGAAYLFYSGGEKSHNLAGIRPVVSLKSDVSYEEIEKIEPQTEETW